MPHTALIYTAVALSGMSALVYELVWIRALGLHFGTSTPAIATVVGTFMAGMALGNSWLGARADRSARPLRLYAALELGIALSGVLVSLLLLRGGASLDALSRLIYGGSATSPALRAVVFSLLLLVPTTLMGGTLPLLSRALMRAGEGGRVLGALYGWNTTGAVLGALLPDLVLVPQAGMTSAVLLAASANVAVALGVARVAGRVSVAAPRDDEAEPDAPAAAADSGAWANVSPQMAWALALSVASGFAGMSFEVLWSRTLSHWSASLATSFAILLSVYLVSLAFGALVTRAHADRTSAPAAWASLWLALSGAAAALSIAFAPWWRDVERGFWPRPLLRRASLAVEATDALWHALYLELLPCLLLGAAFPYVARSIVRASAAGKTAGMLFTINTVASVLGSTVAAFLWLPTLGQQDSYLTTSVLLAVTSLVVAFGSTRGAVRGRFTAAVGSAALVVLATAVALPGEHLLRAHFRGGGHLLELREGATTTAAAAQRFAFGEPYALELLTPGVSMSDTSESARHYMGTMAHAAMLGAGSPERALLICYGVGNTAASLLSYPSLARLDVVDIAGEVLGLGPIFGRAHDGDPLEDPRTRVFVDDGRHHLIAHDAVYDVITAEPPPPNYAGVVNLYSRELYRLARQRLSPHGVITQWLPVFQLSERDMLEMIAAFVAELPHTLLLYGEGEHFVLLGSPSPLSPTLTAVHERTQRDLHRAGLDHLAELYGSVLQTDAELRKLVAGVRPVSDDRPSIQYPWQAVHARPDYPRLFGTNPARAEAFLPRLASPELRAQVAAVSRTLTSALAVVGTTAANSGEADELTRGAEVAQGLALTPRRERLFLLLGLSRELALSAERALSRPPSPDPRAQAARRAAQLTLARRKLYERDFTQALALAEALPESPDDAAHVLLLRGLAARGLGRSAEARAHFAGAAAATRDPSARAELVVLAAQVEAGEGG